ncbi:TPA: fimbrial protein [Yersinia enterocolitica]|nr:fimbrial protein [Yersinia enterocolitica]HDL7833443.1 fimbrial protein [Yersinia enterocolitica]HDL7873999.1 fimbrial protein [Yersinia enterocolitica]HDL7886685.1 fimbrial protein [Yersinia enterocolitica]HDL7894994.1 fimbrial protein [Yersinia enterocolitica]
MNTLKIALILLLLPLQARADAIPLGDINVTLEVTAQPRIEVETPKSINLVNSPKYWSYSYSAEVPITVKLRRQESYRVSVKQPLILARHHSSAINSPAKEFSPAAIFLIAADNRSSERLSEAPKTFNVAKTTSGQTSTGHLLQIFAQAPEGPDIAGKYHGQLTLLFETNS